MDRSGEPAQAKSTTTLPLPLDVHRTILAFSGSTGAVSVAKQLVADTWSANDVALWIHHHHQCPTLDSDPPCLNDAFVEGVKQLVRAHSSAVRLRMLSVGGHEKRPDSPPAQVRAPARSSRGSCPDLLGSELSTLPSCAHVLPPAQVSMRRAHTNISSIPSIPGLGDIIVPRCSWDGLPAGSGSSGSSSCDEDAQPSTKPATMRPAGVEPRDVAGRVAGGWPGPAYPPARAYHPKERHDVCVLHVDAQRSDSVLNCLRKHSVLARDAWAMLSSSPRSAAVLLVHAADSGNVFLCSFLLHTGLAQADWDDSEALVIAAWRDNPDICHMLLNTTRHPAHADAQDHAALIGVTYWGHAYICRQLVEAPHHPARADARDHLALCHAANDGLLETCRILMRAGACPDAQGGLALQAAACNGHLAVCLELMSAPHHAARADMQDSAALLAAAGGGHADVCRALIDPNRPHAARADAQDCAAFILAAQRGYWEVCAVLLNACTHAARANARNSIALIYAARDGLDSFTMLLETDRHGVVLDMERARAQIVDVCGAWLSAEDAVEERASLIQQWVRVMETSWEHYIARKHFEERLQYLSQELSPDRKDACPADQA